MVTPLYIVIVWSELMTLVGLVLLVIGVFLAAFRGVRIATVPLGLGVVALLGVWMNSSGVF